MCLWLQVAEPWAEIPDIVRHADKGGFPTPDEFWGNSSFCRDSEAMRAD